MLSHTRGNIVVENNYKFADLFAGAGGFTVGFKQAGYDAIKAVEFDPSIANTYEMNNPSNQIVHVKCFNICFIFFIKALIS